MFGFGKKKSSDGPASKNKTKYSAADLAAYFQTNQNWSGRTFGELKTALEWIIRTQVLDSCTKEEWESEYKSYYSAQLDYAIYTMDIMNALIPSPGLTIAETNQSNSSRKMDSDTARNSLVGYLNVYFYRYINNIELPKLRGYIQSNPSESTEYVVDVFLTSIIYKSTMDSYPNESFSYHEIEGVPSSRIESLESLRNQIITHYEANNTVRLFQDIFMAMTYYAGSPYRGVHKAVLSLYDGDMKSFREMFFKSLPAIIENKGSLSIKVRS